MSLALDNAFLAELEQHEGGAFEHMYCDSAGYVTVGVGHLLATAADARRIAGWALQRGATGPISPGAIEAEWQLVKSSFRANHRASYYRQFTKLMLPSAVSRSLFRTDVEVKVRELERSFTGWITFPIPARQGLIDMAFNLGTQGVIRKFPRFTRAVRARDWLGAAKECRRRGIQEPRNVGTRERFESAERHRRTLGQRD